MQRIVRGEGQFYRNPLYDFGEVAGGIVRRQQAELRARSGKQAVDSRIDWHVAVGVKDQFGFLAGLHVTNLGFLEIGLNPDVLIRNDRHQISTCLHILAFAGSALADQAADGRVDFAAGQVQFGLGQIGFGVGDHGVEAFDLGAQ